MSGDKEIEIRKLEFVIIAHLFLKNLLLCTMQAIDVN